MSVYDKPALTIDEQIDLLIQRGLRVGDREEARLFLRHISRWLQNLKDAKDRQTIAEGYGLDEKVLVSLAHHLTIVRNHCAHHGRIWNRKIAVKMRIPSKKPSGLSSMFNPSEDQRLYNTLTLLVYLMNIISPASTWRNRVRHLIQSTPVIDATHMGFPSDWQTRAIWREATP